MTLSAKFPGSTLADTLVQYPLSTGGNEVAIGQDQYHAQFCADSSDDVAALMARTQRPITEGAWAASSPATPPGDRCQSGSCSGRRQEHPRRGHRFMAERANPRGQREIVGGSHAMAVARPGEVAETIIEAVRGGELRSGADS